MSVMAMLRQLGSPYRHQAIEIDKVDSLGMFANKCAFQDAIQLVTNWGDPPRTPSAQDRAKGMAEMAEASALMDKVAGGLPQDLRAEVKGCETSMQDTFSMIFQGKTEVAPDQKLETIGLDTLDSESAATRRSGH